MICAHLIHCASGTRRGSADVRDRLAERQGSSRGRRGGSGPQRGRAPDQGEDAARADYLKRFYNEDQELPTHYDLVVSTDKLSAEQATGLIVAAAKAVEYPSRSPPAEP